MNFSFIEALAAIGGGGVATIANETRPPSDYLFNTLLPERNMYTYHIDNATMTVRSTMAGLVAMDSPYPLGGAVEMTTFLEQTAKLAIESKLSEETIRTLQDMLLRLRGTETSSTEVLVQEALNWLNKIIIQPHLDVMEWLRGQALVYGEIDWKFNQKHLHVNYGVPAQNFIERSAAEGYGEEGSMFWQDIRQARRLLKSGVRAIIGHPETLDMIQYNEAHAMATIAEGNGSVSFRRWINQNNAAVAGVFSSDANDAVTLIKYDKEAEILNPADMGTTLRMPFMPVGKLLVVGNNASDGYKPGDGGTRDPEDNTALGYTHIAPTVENGGRTGRWAELYVPERAPWSLHGRSVTNGLPVLQAVEKVVVLTTSMS